MLFLAGRGESTALSSNVCIAKKAMTAIAHAIDTVRKSALFWMSTLINH